MTIDDLLRTGRLERVEADVAVAVTKIEEAQRHLESARTIAQLDPEGAYALLYDAARKAVDAHMAAHGLRASKSRPGAHEAVALYGTAALGGEAKALNRMRKHRNRAEYATLHVSQALIETDLRHAQGMVEAVASQVLG